MRGRDQTLHCLLSSLMGGASRKCLWWMLDPSRPEESRPDSSEAPLLPNLLNVARLLQLWVQMFLWKKKEIKQLFQALGEEPVWGGPPCWFRDMPDRNMETLRCLCEKYSTSAVLFAVLILCQRELFLHQFVSLNRSVLLQGYITCSALKVWVWGHQRLQSGFDLFHLVPSFRLFMTESYCLTTK